jgi:signal transduction histidine kinase
MCDPFYTTKPEGEGTGLGLTITQNILAAHGGELVIESEVGKGSTFKLIFPAARVRTEGPMANPAERPAPTETAAS